jgi:hypothetical protein
VGVLNFERGKNRRDGRGVENQDSVAGLGVKWVRMARNAVDDVRGIMFI